MQNFFFFFFVEKCLKVSQKLYEGDRKQVCKKISILTDELFFNLTPTLIVHYLKIDPCDLFPVHALLLECIT